MDFLYFLEELRVPVVNAFMLLITHLGEESVLLVIALIIFWCVDKYQGYYILSVSFFGVLINQFLKLWYRIPRPWVLDPNFTILEQAREEASGYSFPSGHTQSSVGLFGSIWSTTNRKCLKVLSAILIVLVPFSRMYIGVHTPKDVVVSVVIALILVILLRSLVIENSHRFLPYILIVMAICTFAYLCFVEFYSFPADIDPDNLFSGRKNAYTLLGSVLGLIAVYIIDEKWIHMSTRAVWWVQIIKVTVGLLLVLAVKILLREPLDTLMGEMIGRACRYFLMVIVAGSLWPLSFRRLSKLSMRE